jgi:hypothetical protein
MTAQTRNGSITEQRITDLESKFDELVWYHAELHVRFQAVAAALAAVLAQQMQPQMQQAIMARLMGGDQPNL